MPRRLAIVVTFLLLVVPRWAHGAPQPPYYLALGDSLARGVQPLLNGSLASTNQGFVDDLFAVYRLKHPLLQLKKLGCSGETTASMTLGGVCNYATGNQLAEAIAFIQTHRVAFITLTIGGDDVLGCITADGNIIPGCVPDGLEAIGNYLPQIVAALRIAAGPTVPIVAANYYDPFLAAHVLLPPPAGPDLALQSLQITQVLNMLLENIYTGFGVPVADVARAFRITDFSNVPGFNIPLNVLLELAWTWIGAPAPRGPDIHPNAKGYAVIAGAFVRKIGAL
jgi:lysophospholipase L1-like esterase